MTDCSGCPCLNMDYEYGSACNLGYHTDLFWFDKEGNKVKDTPEMRSHQKDFDLLDASDNCGLIEIRDKSRVIRPIKIKERFHMVTEEKEKTRYYLIKQVNTSAGRSPIIGITTDENYAKSRQSVFCEYEEVNLLPPKMPTEPKTTGWNHDGDYY